MDSFTENKKSIILKYNRPYIIKCVPFSDGLHAKNLYRIVDGTKGELIPKKYYMEGAKYVQFKNLIDCIDVGVFPVSKKHASI